jgi:hypothetical protein
MNTDKMQKKKSQVARASSPCFFQTESKKTTDYTDATDMRKNSGIQFLGLVILERSEGSEIRATHRLPDPSLRSRMTLVGLSK